MKCFSCKKKSSVGLKCKWCNIEFCSYCINIDIHLCSQSEFCKSSKQSLLSEQLEKNKTQTFKVQKI